jgi:hypothetical protein
VRFGRDQRGVSSAGRSDGRSADSAPTPYAASGPRPPSLRTAARG